MLLEVLSLEIYPNVTYSFLSVPHVETDWQRSITVHPVRTDVPGHCLPLEHLPCQAEWPTNAKPWPMTY